ncbi:Gfo/Idh/MocA family protein [Kiloniella laminariae]|uniref:Gfo/Idh/MocA family protein n=1 Tax=Kiloniella laminariae TaxID=454162 RepID=UPI00037D3FB0|nr:Gfo/Idh/MocA family oxidoreductase [Kiloniella laminariae]
MTKKLKVGIAGHGLVGKRRHNFIDMHPLFCVTAVSDQTYNLVREKRNNLCYYGDYRQMIEQEDLDVLFVCLPNHVAADATIMGLKKNCHVFCEKPPGRNVQDIRRVIEVEKCYSNLKLKYGFNHRYHDSVLDALKIVKEKTLGRIINIRGIYGKSVLTPKIKGITDPNDPVYWRAQREIAGGGILLDQGIHMLDLIRCYAGEFTEIKSFVTNDFWNKDVEDNAYALMRTNEGVVAFIQSSATQWRHKFSLEMMFEKGALTLSGILSSTRSYGQEVLTIAYREEENGGNPRETTTSYIYDNSWEREIAEFADSILNDQPVSVGTSLDALKTMELVYRIYCADPEWQSKYSISID